MSTNSNCPACGTPLPQGVFGDSCPRCQLTSALGSSGAEKQFDVSPAPRQLGDYELLEEIGRGGMGVVYRARQVSLNRVVALKMTLSGPFAHPDTVRRFRAEAETIARLQHGNIVGIYEFGEAEGRLFFSMECVTGHNLAVVARTQPFSIRDAAGLVRTLTEAVAYAHALGIVHRDLKPTNILIDELGQPRITDFGLAKTLASDAELTHSGESLGSPSFCAPEQAAGRRGEVGVRSDVYSLGAVLYFLLTGRPPLLAETVEQTLWQVLNAEPVAPRLLNPGVPEDLQTICLRCLEKNPVRRYATATELADELGRFLRGEPIRARPVRDLERGWRWCRRHPTLATTVLGVLLLVTTVAAIVSVASVRLARKEQALRRSAYAADMRQTQRAIEAGNFGLANYHLNLYRPPRRPSELRGWEWRYFWGQSRTDAEFRVGRHDQAVGSLAVSPDGRRLASAGSEGDVKLWDLSARQELATRRFPSHVNALAFSPDGRWLAIASSEGEVYLCDSNTLTNASEPWRQASEVVALQFTAGGSRIQTVATDPVLGRNAAVLTVWNVEQRHLEREYKFPHGGLLAMSRDGRQLAVGRPGGGIRLLRLAEHGETSAPREAAEVIVPNAHPDKITALAFSPDGQFLVSGSFDRTARVWDARTGTLKAALGGLNGMVSALAFSPDGRQLAVASDDQAIRLWDPIEWRETATFQGHMSGISAVRFSPQGEWLVTGGKGGEIRLWNPAEKPARASYQRFTLPGRVVYVGEHHALARSANQLVWAALDTGEEFWRADLPDSETTAFGAALNGSRFGLGTVEGELWLWDGTAAASPVRLPLDSVPISMLELSSEGDLAAVVLAERTIKLVELETKRVLASLGTNSTPVSALGFSPDRRLLGIGYEDGTSVVWDVVRQDILYRPVPHNLKVTALAFAPDNRQLATSGEDGMVVLSDVRAARQMGVLQGVAGVLWSVSWSPDARRLATGTGEGTVLIWDLASQEQVATLKGHESLLVRARFLADDNTVVTFAANELLLWQAPPFAETY